MVSGLFNLLGIGEKPLAFRQKRLYLKCHMNARIRNTARELKAGLESIYGQRLEGVYVYGSYARGEQDSESDIDVLVILDKFDHYSSEVDRTSYLVSELSLKYEVSVSRVFVSQRAWSERRTPFLASVHEEVIPA